jgi:hypothetical protein
MGLLLTNIKQPAKRFREKQPTPEPGQSEFRGQGSRSWGQYDAMGNDPLALGMRGTPATSNVLLEDRRYAAYESVGVCTPGQVL